MKKIVLLGDSIRRGYDRYTKMAFDGEAMVYYPDDNCRFAPYFLRYLNEWKNSFKCGDDVDCVHWNVGLWDTLRADDGELFVPPEIYKYYIDRICKYLKMLYPNAKIIFATSTPVQEELFTGFKRYNKMEL